MTYIFLFSRDFRIYDNKTLLQISKKNHIIPIFIFDPKQINPGKNKYFSNNSVQCLCEGIKDLSNSIEKLGGELYIYHGNTISILKSILDKNIIKGIAYNKDITPFALKRNKKIKSLTQRLGIKHYCLEDFNLFPFNSILTNEGKVYMTFRYFYEKAIKRRDEITITIKKKIKFKKINDPNKWKLDKIDTLYQRNNNLIISEVSRDRGLEILNSLEKYYNYGNDRKYPQYNTSLLSVYLKYGLISIREAYLKMYDTLGRDSELLRQLIWKEYYYYLMYHLPVNKTIGKSNIQGKKLTWENNLDYFDAWKKGKMGYPFLDACMNQLNTTGWMHNRGRLCVANALTYLFLIDWKWGEKYFAQNLLDYDVTQNNLNWQWCAGVGIDRKPYLRMYNPFTLQEKYDPDCKFVKKYLPDCHKIPNEHLLDWEKYHNLYPNMTPIVNYKDRRELAIKIKI